MLSRVCISGVCEENPCVDDDPCTSDQESDQVNVAAEALLQRFDHEGARHEAVTK